jgi:hypothetical protein
LYYIAIYLQELIGGFIIKRAHLCRIERWLFFKRGGPKQVQEFFQHILSRFEMKLSNTIAPHNSLQQIYYQDAGFRI